MLRFFLRKIVQGLVMLLVVSGLTFALLSAAGGDAFSALRENPQISAKTIEHLRNVYGLDQPWPVGYAKWLGGAVTGDLGESISFRVPVGGLIWNRLLSTGLLGAFALFIAIVVSVVLCLLAVRFPNKALDAFIEFLILITSSTPRIVLALLALLLTVYFSGGVGGSETGPLKIILASLALAVPLTAIFLAQTREALGQAMKEDFVQYARAKGLSEWAIITRHALRAAINPFLTLFGLSLGALLGGSVIVETVLGWPGIGALTVNAVRNRDIPVVMAVVLITSSAVWFGNALAELLQQLNDKRIRYENDSR